MHCSLMRPPVYFLYLTSHHAKPPMWVVEQMRFPQDNYNSPHEFAVVHTAWYLFHIDLRCTTPQGFHSPTDSFHHHQTYQPMNRGKPYRLMYPHWYSLYLTSHHAMPPISVAGRWWFRQGNCKLPCGFDAARSWWYLFHNNLHCTKRLEYLQSNGSFHHHQRCLPKQMDNLCNFPTLLTIQYNR